MRRARAKSTRIFLRPILSPQNTASRALELSRDCQAICVTAAVHPVVTEALDRITDDGVPVFAFITQLSATGQFPYVGLDNWKVGRQAAWAIANVCKAPGKVLRWRAGPGV